MVPGPLVSPAVRTFVIKQTFYLQKVEALKFFQMYYCEYLMNILCKYEKKKKKIKVRFYLFAFLEIHVLCATLWEMGPQRVL